MTTIYRPAIIETVAQAEALPKGSVVFDGEPEDGDTYVRVGGDWHTNGYPGRLSEAVALGFTVTALVPVEAKEERTWVSSKLTGPMYMGFGAAFDAPHARLVTPWEEA